MICPKCQKENLDVAKFCVKCGTSLLPVSSAQQNLHQKIEQPKATTVCKGCGKPLTVATSKSLCPVCIKSETEKKELEYKRLFVGDKADYYLSKWNAVEHAESNKGTFLSTNWAAYIGGVVWFAYRKMYYQSLLLSMLVALALFVVAQTNGSFVSGLVLILFWGIAGKTGNDYYLKYAKKKIDDLKRKHGNDVAVLKQEITKTGGTSIVSAIAVSILLSMVVIVPVGLDAHEKNKRKEAYDNYMLITMAPCKELATSAVADLNTLLSELSTLPATDVSAWSEKLDNRVTAKHKNIVIKLEVAQIPDIAKIREFHGMLLTSFKKQLTALEQMSQAAKLNNAEDFGKALDIYNEADKYMADYANKFKASSDSKI